MEIEAAATYVRCMEQHLYGAYESQKKQVWMYNQSCDVYVSLNDLSNRLASSVLDGLSLHTCF